MTDLDAATTARIFTDGLDLFDQVLQQVQPEQWDTPSPCAGWTVQDVLGHLGTSVELGAAFLSGARPNPPEADRPADLVQGDPVAWYRTRAEDARRALAGADLEQVVDTPMGPRRVVDRLAFPALDLYVHAWDLGAPLGIDVAVPQDVIDLGHASIDPFPVEMVRGEGGAFGPEVPAPEGATPTEAFIAWTGRTPR